MNDTPLVKEDLYMHHQVCEDSWYSCPQSTEGCANEFAGDECNCGAEEHNKRVDKYVAAEEAEIERLRTLVLNAASTLSIREDGVINALKVVELLGGYPELEKELRSLGNEDIKKALSILDKAYAVGLWCYTGKEDK